MKQAAGPKTIPVVHFAPKITQTKIKRDSRSWYKARNSPGANWSHRLAIDQFRYIKIQPKTIHFSTRLLGINTEFVGFIPQRLVLRPIVLSRILIYRNWSIVATRVRSRISVYEKWATMDLCYSCGAEYNQKCWVGGLDRGKGFGVLFLATPFPPPPLPPSPFSFTSFP